MPQDATHAGKKNSAKIFLKNWWQKSKVGWPEEKNQKSRVTNSSHIVGSSQLTVTYSADKSSRFCNFHLAWEYILQVVLLQVRQLQKSKEWARDCLSTPARWGLFRAGERLLTSKAVTHTQLLEKRLTIILQKLKAVSIHLVSQGFVTWQKYALACSSSFGPGVPPTLANRDLQNQRWEVCVRQAADLVAGKAGAQRVTESWQWLTSQPSAQRSWLHHLSPSKVNNSTLKEWGEGQVRADEQGGREEWSETQQGRMKILASDLPLPLVVHTTANHAVCFLTCVAGLSSRQHRCENRCDRNIPQIWGLRQGTNKGENQVESRVV